MDGMAAMPGKKDSRVRLLISGYYGFGNQGDEWLLEGLLSAFSDYSASITVLSRNPAATKSRHNIRAVARWNPWVILRELKKCQALISGGGGLIQDLSGCLSPWYYAGLIAMARRWHKPAILLGQGFGPLTRKGNNRLANKILSQACLLVPRDQPGWEWCRQHGVLEEQLVLGADLAWLLPFPKSGSGQGWLVILRSDWLGGVIPEWMGNLAGLARKKGIQVRFTALGHPDDEQLLEWMKFREEYKGCDFISLPGAGNWQAVSRLFAGTDLVISMRYHGILLGAQVGAVVTGFGPDPKIKNLLHDLEQPELDIYNIEAGLNNILERAPELSRCVALNREKLRARAQAGVAAAQRVLMR